MKRLQKVLDDYYIDAMAGLLPWGIGDIATALFALVYIWFAATKVRSLALTLAVVNNSLRDIALGLIPFYIGDVIDFFYRSNKQNMQLIEGFVEDDQEIIAAVNKGAIRAACFICLSIFFIAFMLWTVLQLSVWLWHTISAALS